MSRSTDKILLSEVGKNSYASALSNDIFFFRFLKFSFLFVIFVFLYDKNYYSLCLFFCQAFYIKICSDIAFTRSVCFT